MEDQVGLTTSTAGGKDDDDDDGACATQGVVAQHE